MCTCAGLRACAKTPPMTDILIRGAGLLGTSLGLALSQTGARTFLEDRDPGAVATAVGMGAGTDADCPAPEVVFVAVPPDQIAREVAAALTRFPQATVSDVGSVKSEPIAALAAVAADLSRYVGGHPMAGREISGAAAGRETCSKTGRGSSPRSRTPIRNGSRRSAAWRRARTRSYA